MQENLQDSLKDFGLTDNEIKIYVEILKNGASTPTLIAKKTGFSRPYIYDALERMLEKEIVSTVYISKNKSFRATEPAYLVELEIQKLEKLKSIVPDLEKLKRSVTDNIKVEHYTGTDIYKMLLTDVITTLPKGGELLMFGMDDEYLLKNNKHWITHLKHYYLRIGEIGVKEKIIAKKGGFIYSSPETTEIKYLNKKIIGNIAFEVYGNKVGIFLWGIPNHLILIENKKVAESYRNQFNLLWKIAKK